MHKREKERIKRIKINQKASKTLRKAQEHATTLTETGVELSFEVARRLTLRQLQHAMLRPQKFISFMEFERVAAEVLLERKLQLEQEEKRG